MAGQTTRFSNYKTPLHKIAAGHPWCEEYLLLWWFEWTLHELRLRHVQGQYRLTAYCLGFTLGRPFSGAYGGSLVLKLFIISCSSRLSLESFLRGRGGGSCLNRGSHDALIEVLANGRLTLWNFMVRICKFVEIYQLLYWNSETFLLQSHSASFAHCDTSAFHFRIQNITIPSSGFWTMTQNAWISPSLWMKRYLGRWVRNYWTGVVKRTDCFSWLRLKFFYYSHQMYIIIGYDKNKILCSYIRLFRLIGNCTFQS